VYLGAERRYINTLPFLFTNEGQIWCARVDPRSTLTGQISSERVHCVRFRRPKTTIIYFGQILTFWGFLLIVLDHIKTICATIQRLFEQNKL